MSKINNFMVRKVASLQARVASKEEGQGLAEYGLILALVAILCVGALGLLQGSIDGILTDVSNAI
jgi:pilus assembly protein Flp/PilA